MKGSIKNDKTLGRNILIHSGDQLNTFLFYHHSVHVFCNVQQPCMYACTSFMYRALNSSLKICNTGICQGDYMLCVSKKLYISYQIKYLFASTFPADYHYFKIMQWFRVEMAPVASSITVLDTQRQLMYCIFEIDY